MFRAATTRLAWTDAFLKGVFFSVFFCPVRVKANEQKIRLPAVDRLLQQLSGLIEIHGRQMVAGSTRAELAAARAGVRHGLPLPDESSLLAGIRRRADEAGRPNLRAGFNLTGTVLHTNLGRA